MTTAKNTNYNKLNAELDNIMLSLESSELDIDEAAKLYERGMEIIQEIDKYLKTAENTVTKVKAKWKNAS